MQQAWHETNENDFMPAQIRFGWEEATLWVFAQLQDNDIFNAATKPNQATHLLGDVLEIFLRLAWQNQYFELHVTPENQTMQLRWPRVHHNFKDEEDKPVESESCSNVLRHTVTRVETAENRWQVLAAVDARAVSERLLQPNDRWFFSVSRYDYTRGRAHPILSSTSPHREINFHRHAEWGQLLFTDESACG